MSHNPLARAILSAAGLLGKSSCKQILAERYASFDGGKGYEFGEDRITLEQPLDYKANPTPQSVWTGRSSTRLSSACIVHNLNINYGFKVVF